MSEKPTFPILSPYQHLSTFCERWPVQKVALFGSVLRDDFSPESDIDILVQFFPEALHTLGDEDRMQEELSAIFDHEVDMVDWQAIEESSNYFRRKQILANYAVIYAR